MPSSDMISLPNPTLRRLPQYLKEIKKLKNTGEISVSCTKLSEISGILPITVRKDLQQAGAVGKPKRGYRIDEVIGRLEAVLGLDSDRKAILIGAGNLGYALLGFQGFKACGVDIVAALDSDENKIGRAYHNKKIVSLDKLETLIERFGIKLAIITTPPDVAQEIADRLAAAGICGIWNFSSATINVPKSVALQNEDLTASLSILLSKVGK